MTIKKYKHDKTEEITIQNLIDATVNGKFKWVKIDYGNCIQYQHTSHLDGTKMLIFKIYLYNGDNIDLNISMAQSSGRNFVHVLHSQKKKIQELVDIIETTKNFNSNLV